MSASATIKAILVAGALSSAIATAGYAITPPPAPALSPAPGTYTSAQTITLSDADSAAVLYYTTDGSTPSISSARYNGPVSLSSTTTLSVVAVDGGLSSTIDSGTYTLMLPPPQAAGYSLVWSDNFSSLNVCSANVSHCNWYNPGAVGTRSQGVITDPLGSYINLDWQGSQGNSVTIASTYSMDGQYGHAWTFGYFEISMAFDPDSGSWPALWMHPVQTIFSDPFSGAELDLFEWQSQTPTDFYGTAHVWVNGSNAQQNISPALSGIIWSNFNTYGVLWTPTTISWYLNNVLLGTVSTTSAPYNTVYGGQQSLFLILSMGPGCDFTYPCTAQQSPLNMKVQWVHVFQR